MASAFPIRCVQVLCWQSLVRFLSEPFRLQETGFEAGHAAGTIAARRPPTMKATFIKFDSLYYSTAICSDVLAGPACDE